MAGRRPSVPVLLAAGAFVFLAPSLLSAGGLVSQVRPPVPLAFLAMLALLTLLATVALPALSARLFATALGTTLLPAVSRLTLPPPLAARRRTGTAAGVPALGARQPLGGSARRPVAAGLVTPGAAAAGLLWLSSLLASAAHLATADRLRRALPVVLALLTLSGLSLLLGLLARSLSFPGSSTLIVPALLAAVSLLVPSSLLAGLAVLATLPGVVPASPSPLLCTLRATGRFLSAVPGSGLTGLLAGATPLGASTALLVALFLATAPALGVVASLGRWATALRGLVPSGRLPLLPARRLLVLAGPAGALGPALGDRRRLLA